MKIRITEYTTEIEADARELRESNTLSGNFISLLSRALQNHEPFDDSDDDDCEDEVQDND